MAGAPGDARPFTFTNRTGRGSGPVLSWLSRLSPGVAEVQAQVAPYAAASQAANLATLSGSGERVRWVALGDSMTQGIGASDPSRGWVGQARDRLSVEVDLINLSQSGGRVEDVLADQLPAWRRLAPARYGEIVTVLIGSNDVMSPVHRRLLEDSFAELLEQLPRGAILATLPYPTALARRVNARIGAAGAAGALRVVVTDQLGPGSWNGKLAADRFHPNDAGYAVIADAFAEAVEGALDAVLDAHRGLDPSGRTDSEPG